MKTANYFKHKNPTWRTMIIAGLAGLSLAGCRDNDFDWDAAYGTKLDYIFAKEFQKQFGEIDPTHDWSTGTVITADVDLSAWTSGSAVLRVMTSMPILDDCVMLYKGTVSGASTIYFDAPRHLTHVYVTAEQDGKYVLGQYFEIEDETCSIKTSETRARTNDVCYTTINQNKKVDLTKDDKASTKYYLKNVHSSRATGTLNIGDVATKMTIRELAKYVGNSRDAYFTEANNNRDQYDNVFKRDVIYTVAEEGPVWIDCFFGATTFINQFGYYYYKNDGDKISANKYVLIDDARPYNIVTVDPAQRENYPANWKMYPGMFLAQYWINGLEKKPTNPYLTRPEDFNVQGNEMATGTKYRLVYFGEDGSATPSFNFPKGTKIGFFIHKIGDDDAGKVFPLKDKDNQNLNDGILFPKDEFLYNLDYDYDDNNIHIHHHINESNTSNIRYSDTELNSFYNPAVKFNGQDYWAAISCRIGDKIVCAFEDNPSGGDSDMNDIMFFVEGVDPSEVPHIPVDEPKLNECIIAYEDLGTTDDFDFNDVVISVSAPYQGYSYIRLLAAGGTLDTKVIYTSSSGNDQELIFNDPQGNEQREVHKAFGVSQKTMVNTGRHQVRHVPTARINVGNNSGWTVDANKHRFAIKVQQAKGEERKINIPYTKGEVPQAFLIADPKWEWPNERQNIKDKYAGFETWVHNNLTNNTWYSAAWGEQSSNN